MHIHRYMHVVCITEPTLPPVAMPRRVWRVRWAQGGVCPAVSERYSRSCREAFGGFSGPRVGCVRRFRAGTIEVLPRGLWVRWAQGGVFPAVSERYTLLGGPGAVIST